LDEIHEAVSLMTDTPIEAEGEIGADIEEIGTRFERLSISPAPRPSSFPTIFFVSHLTPQVFFSFGFRKA